MLIPTATVARCIVSQMWNDSAIVGDQTNPRVAKILSNLHEKIKVIVRNDKSGTSEIFTGALGLFDPRKYRLYLEVVVV
jgi:ABC-type phosphate transport system substrate-binding protein